MADVLAGDEVHEVERIIGLDKLITLPDFNI